MARALFDMNVVIALMDASHVFHARAHQWWEQQQSEGWASCPLTENGVIRIMSAPAYSQNAAFSIPQLVKALRSFKERTNHQFWPDDLSFLDSSCFEPGLVLSSRQITDVYLLALAVKNEGCLVTFDQGIPVAAVAGVQSPHLLLL